MALRSFLVNLDRRGLNALELDCVILKLLEAGYQTPENLAEAQWNGGCFRLLQCGPTLSEEQLDFIRAAVSFAGTVIKRPGEANKSVASRCSNQVRSCPAVSIGECFMRLAGSEAAT